MDRLLAAVGCQQHGNIRGYRGCLDRSNAGLAGTGHLRRAARVLPEALAIAFKFSYCRACGHVRGWDVQPHSGGEA